MSGSVSRRPRYYVQWFEGTGCPRVMRSYLASVLWRQCGDEYSLYLSQVQEFKRLEPIQYAKVDGVTWVLPSKEDPWHAHPDFCLEGLVEMPRLKRQSHEIIYLRTSDRELIHVERSFLDD